jgi:hypothetical protein
MIISILIFKTISEGISEFTVLFQNQLFKKAPVTHIMVWQSNFSLFSGIK